MLIHLHMYKEPNGFIVLKAPHDRVCMTFVQLCSFCSPTDQGKVDPPRLLRALSSRLEPGGLWAGPTLCRVSSVTLASCWRRVFLTLTAAKVGSEPSHPSAAPGAPLPQALLEAGPRGLRSLRQSAGVLASLWGQRWEGEVSSAFATAPRGIRGRRHLRASRAPCHRGAVAPGPLPSRPVPPAPPGAVWGRGRRPGLAPPAAAATALAAQPEVAGRARRRPSPRRGSCCSGTGRSRHRGIFALCSPPAAPAGIAAAGSAAEGAASAGGSGGAPPRGAPGCCPTACWMPMWWTWRSGGTRRSTT